MRQKIVAGNWKMNMNFQDGLALADSVISGVDQPKGMVILGTPYIHLAAVSEKLKSHPAVFLASQNCHQEEKGAFTGEISVAMLQSVGVDYVILGHSERRQYFQEDNALLARKVDAVLAAGMRPIFCCGEPLEIREAESHVDFVEKQLKEGLFHLSPDAFSKVVIAYEPIWAIGTGRTASADQAQEMHAAIRKMLADNYGEEPANTTSILYGGSCNAQNAAELFACPDVDGGLIGGASLKPADFLTIIAAMG